MKVNHCPSAYSYGTYRCNAFGVQNGEYVTVEADGIRSIAYPQCKIRVTERYRLEMHIDTDEANAGLITQGSIGRLVKSNDRKRNEAYASSEKGK